MARCGLGHALRHAAGRASGHPGRAGMSPGRETGMRPDDRYRDGLTGDRDDGLDGWAAGTQTAGQHQPPAPRPGADGGERRGLGGLWLLLAPIACCGGPFLIAALAAAGALAWAGLGLAAAAVAALVALVLIRRRRRSRACCAPGAASRPGGAGASARRPAER